MTESYHPSECSGSGNGAEGRGSSLQRVKRVAERPEHNGRKEEEEEPGRESC